MKQDQDLLARVSQGAISDPQKCALCYAVYKEFLESEMDAVQLNYDAQLNEIYLKLSRGGRESICLPRSINDRLDFDQIDSFRKRLQDTQYPIQLAIADYTQTTLLYDIHEGSPSLTAAAAPRKEQPQ